MNGIVQGILTGSATDSVIGGNITVNTGSTTGSLSRDPDTANGYIKDKFDANKMQNDFTKQNNLTQNLTTIGNTLTDITVSTIDKHNPEVIADGKETGHMISSGLGSVGGAALGGGLEILKEVGQRLDLQQERIILIAN